MNIKEIMKITHYIKRLWLIPLLEKKLLFKGILYSLAFVPVVYLLPLKHYIWILRNKPKSSKTVDDKRYFILLVRKTIRRIERFSLFKFSCLVKSITFKMLLNYIGIDSTIALGIDNSHPHLLRAHAFVKVDDEVIYLKRKKYYEIYSLE